MLDVALPGQLSRRVPPAKQLRRIGEFRGEPIEVCFLPNLTSWRGHLLSGEARGTAVHAGSFLRKRKIILDRALAEQPNEQNRILIHEVLHFAWLRLGNRRRQDYEDVLAEEIRVRARGELGWSAEWRKLALRPEDVAKRTRRWREYVCESFCDSGAWLAIRSSRNEEFSLAEMRRRRRRAWFEEHLSGRVIQV